MQWWTTIWSMPFQSFKTMFNSGDQLVYLPSRALRAPAPVQRRNLQTCWSWVVFQLLLEVMLVMMKMWLVVNHSSSLSALQTHFYWLLVLSAVFFFELTYWGSQTSYILWNLMRSASKDRELIFARESAYCRSLLTNCRLPPKEETCSRATLISKPVHLSSDEDPAKLSLW